MNKVLITILTALCSTSAVHAADKVNKMCVFDILGANGPIFGVAKDYQLEAQRQGYPFTPVVFTDERVAMEEFKTGGCQGLVATGLRTRAFNSFTGSIDSIGALPTYDALRTTIVNMSDPKLAKLMVVGKYEIGGILPFGAAYIYVNDRAINTLAKASGKKIVALDYDKAQAKLIQKIGAQPVSADITNFGPKFNNGSVDIIAAPAVAYRPLELFRGMGTKGAIVRFPIAQLTLQIVLDKDAFPPGTGQKMRTYVASQFDQALGVIKKIEAEVPNNVWMDINDAEKKDYSTLMREARIALRDEGIYDKRTLTLMRKVRCQINAADAECAQPLE